MSQTYQNDQIGEMLLTMPRSKRSDTDFLDGSQETILRYKESHVNPLFGKSSEDIMNSLLNHQPTEEGDLLQYMVSIIKC